MLEENASYSPAESEDIIGVSKEQWLRHREHEHTMADETEPPYTPTPSDRALIATLSLQELVNVIQQLYTDEKYSLATCNKLYAAAGKVRKALGELSEDLETKTDITVPAPAPMSEEEVTETINALLARLPAGYPPATFSKQTEGYMLIIEETNSYRASDTNEIIQWTSNTTVYRSASAEDAIKHTTNYVEARERHADLPVGVIYGIYD